jgi:ParB family transcriptional regulator, chromosome partitioning protein
MTNWPRCSPASSPAASRRPSKRLTVIRALSQETGASAFATIRALVRHPTQASEAYVAMVEENEIRVGLSYYERARIVLKSFEQGVFGSEKKALYGLFSTASKAKRSKIGSFITVVRHLDGALVFPVRLPERLGLVLARALEADDRLAGRIAARLGQARPADAAAEQALIAAILAPPVAEAEVDATPTLDRPKDAEEIAPGVYLQTGGGLLRPRYTLSGPRVDPDFLARLVLWLQDGG